MRTHGVLNLWRHTQVRHEQRTLTEAIAELDGLALMVVDPGSKTRNLRVWSAAPARNVEIASTLTVTGRAVAGNAEVRPVVQVESKHAGERFRHWDRLSAEGYT
jgi:hypothetical protein